MNMNRKNDNIMVMLFHTRDAADRFCQELKDRGFSDSDMKIIDRSDLPEYGRGEHATGTAEKAGGFLNKLGDMFGGGTDLDVSRYHNLDDYLKDKGLDAQEARYYQDQVEAGSCMLVVKAGDRFQEVRRLAEEGVGGSQAIRRETEPGVSPSPAREKTVPIADREGERDTGHSDQQRMRLYGERPVVEHHEARTGEVDISKRVVSETETVNVPVTREELVIERHPVDDKDARAADVNFDETAGETIRVPLREEDATITKEPVLEEEVDIGKRTVRETRREPVTLRHEEMEINKQGDITDEDIQGDIDREKFRRDKPAA